MMSPKLEAAIAAVQALSSTERQQLLQMLIDKDPAAAANTTQLKRLSHQFWQGISLEQLLTHQKPTTVDDVHAFVADFWPQEDSIDEFLNFLRQQRREAVS